MSKVLSIVLIIGFLLIDMLFFHDIFKPGEVISLPQFLTGILSIPVIYISIQSLIKQNNHSLKK